MWFFKKINKFDQPLVRFIKKNNWTHKLPTSWVKNLNIDPSDINWIIIYEQSLYIQKFRLKNRWFSLRVNFMVS